MTDAIKIVQEEDQKRKSEPKPGMEQIQYSDSLLTSTLTSQTSPLITKKAQDAQKDD